MNGDFQSSSTYRQSTSMINCSVKKILETDIAIKIIKLFPIFPTCRLFLFLEPSSLKCKLLLDKIRLNDDKNEIKYDMKS